jgi:hypothetical protein
MKVEDEAKKKAEQLIYQFKYCNGRNVNDDMINTHVKQCALICVDEIIQALESHTWQNRKLIEYWQKVKQEINKQKAGN